MPARAEPGRAAARRDDQRGEIVRRQRHRALDARALVEVVAVVDGRGRGDGLRQPAAHLDLVDVERLRGVADRQIALGERLGLDPARLARPARLRARRGEVGVGDGLVGLDRRRRGLGARRAIDVAVLADHARETPRVRRGLVVVGREQQRDEVRAERARRVLELVLDHLRLAAEQLHAARRRLRALDERAVDRDHVVPRAGLRGEADEVFADVIACSLAAGGDRLVACSLAARGDRVVACSLAAGGDRLVACSLAAGGDRLVACSLAAGGDRLAAALVARPRERREHVGDRALGIVDALVEDVSAAQVQLDALRRRRGRERDVVRVAEALPRVAVVDLAGDAIELREQAGVARRHRQRLAEHRHRARLVAEPPLDELAELARQRDVARGIVGHAGVADRDEPLALVGEHLGELAPQAVRLAGAPHVGERALVGRLLVRAPPPPERGLGIAELVGGRRRDPLHERAPLLGGRLASRIDAEHPLDHLHVLLEAAEPVHDVRRGGHRLVLLGVELEHALERLQRARRVVEPVAADHADLEAAGDLPLGLGRQVHLALGDAHRGVEVAARLVQAAQRGVCLEVVRVDRLDQLVEHADRLGGRAEPGLEHVGALERGHRRALAIVDDEDRDLQPEDLDELAPLGRRAVQPRERVERGAALRRQLEHAVPRLDRAHGIAEVRVDDARVALELERAHRTLGRARGRKRAAAVEALEHLRELGPALRALVQAAERGERVGIRRRRAQRLLPAIERGGVIFSRACKLREPLEQLGALGRAGRRGRVILERLLEARIVGLLEHALHALERVAVAGEELQHRAAREHDAVDVGEPRLVEDREPAQHRQALAALVDRPLDRRVGRPVAAQLRGLVIEHAAQRRGEAGVVALALVQLGERLERRLVAGVLGDDLLVQLDGAARLDLSLAVGLRHLLERVHAGDRIARGRDLLLEADDQLLPHLAARGQAAERLGHLPAAVLELRDPLPRLDRARDVAEAELRELRDLLEAADEIVRFGARFARVVERELVELDQAAPVATLAEVIDVARDGLFVRRHHTERLVQQLRGAIAIAHVLARDGRQLEQLADDRLRRRVRVLAERVDLGLHQPRQRLPVLIVAEQRLELVAVLAAGRLVRHQLGQALDQAGAIGELVAVEREAALRDVGAILGLGRHARAVAQDAIELLPLRRLRQRLLEHLARRRRVRIDAHRAAQIVDAGEVVVRRQPLAADLDEQLARLVAPGALIATVAKAGRRVDLGERLRDVERGRIEARGLLEVVRGGVEVVRSARDLAELVAEVRPLLRVAVRAEHVELGLVELADHLVVAERDVQLARGVERLGALRLELPRLLEVPQRAIDAAEVIVPQLRGVPVLRRAARDQLALAAALTLRELGEAGLDDLDGRRRIARLDELEQPIGRAVVRGIELERGAQVVDRRRGLAEDDHRLAGLGPRVCGADRIALVLRVGRAQLGEQLAAAGGAKLVTKLVEALGLRLLPEHDDPGFERIDLRVWHRVFGHRARTITRR